MNNASGLYRNYREGYSTRRIRSTQKAAPAWLVMICRLILWLAKEEVRGVLCAMLAIGAVGVLAIVAGAMGCGAVPLAQGVIICVSLGAMALFATRDF